MVAVTPHQETTPRPLNATVQVVATIHQVEKAWVVGLVAPMAEIPAVPVMVLLAVVQVQAATRLLHPLARVQALHRTRHRGKQAPTAMEAVSSSQASKDLAKTLLCSVIQVWRAGLPCLQVRTNRMAQRWQSQRCRKSLHHSKKIHLLQRSDSKGRKPLFHRPLKGECPTNGIAVRVCCREFGLRQSRRDDP